MNAVQLVCGFPLCSKPQEEQTDLSIGLRVTLVVLGVFSTIVGTLILLEIPGLSHVGTTTGWSFTSAGIFLILVSASIKQIKRSQEKTTKVEDLIESSPLIHKKQSLSAPPPQIPQMPKASDPKILGEAKKVLEQTQHESRVASFFGIFGHEGNDQPKKLRELVDEEGIQTLGDLSLYFSYEHWDALTDDQFLALDYLKLFKSHKNHHVNALVKICLLQKNASHRLSLLLDQKPDVFYAFCEFLCVGDWQKFLNFKKDKGSTEADLIKVIDFSRFSKQAFDRFYPIMLLNLPNILPVLGTKADGYKKIEDLKNQCGVSNTMPGYWWQFLSSQQAILVAKNFGHFTQGFTDAEKGMVFFYLFGDLQGQTMNKAGRLALLRSDAEGLQALYSLSPFLSPGQWRWGLSWEQKKEFDFPNIDQAYRCRAFNNLFGNAYELLRELNDEEVLIVASRFWKIKTEYKAPMITKICDAFRSGRSGAITTQLNTIFQDCNI